MLFNSFPFAVFLVVVLCLYYPLPHRAQNVLLLVASCFFYASWDWRFLFPLLFSTSIDYVCAMKMQAIGDGTATTGRSRKFYLYVSVSTNLCLLGFFKYFNFFAVSMEQMLRHAGLHVSPWTLQILLPIGISFYTFQALSYTIDVYRGELHSDATFFDFLLAILYFPHLVAGPIQRAHSLLPQVMQPRQITRAKLSEGVHLIFSGFFKKVFIADNVAPIVNHVFGRAHATGFETAVGVFAFAIQIYCDFSGYTDIARGVARVMGFQFMLNFNLPYFAKNPSDFWNRWHISLSSWLRDYLYIPLGGNRGKEWKVKRNLMLTMVIGGLWHGAAWHFVLWGFYHGVLLVAHRQAGRLGLVWPAAKSGVGRFLWTTASVGLMFLFTCYGWLLFRADDMRQVGAMTVALLHPLAGFDAQLDGQLGLKVLAYSAPLLVVQCLQRWSGRLNFADFLRLPAEARVVLYAVCTYFVFFLGGQTASFIYFQF
jgi:alginate O-acetyltransferase complex protein AlgI